MRNSRGEWESVPKPTDVPLGLVFARRGAAGPEPRGGADPAGPGQAVAAVGGGNGPVAWGDGFVPVLTVQAALERTGQGWIVGLQESGFGRVYGRGFKVADVLTGERVVLVKWVRRLVDWHGRVATWEAWEREILPRLEAALTVERTPIARVVRQEERIAVHVSVASVPVPVWVDSHGIALWRPETREVAQPTCTGCEFQPACRQLSPGSGTAALWRRLNLVDEKGVPTRRGRVVAALSQTVGLALAAALEEEGYPLDELVYDLANLDAGFRFAGEDSRWGGRLAIACQKAYGMLNVPGYLENGLPPRYGAGANEVVQLAHRHPERRHRAESETLGEGDVDRLIIEWRSLLRQIAHAPALEWGRWTALQAMAKGILHETESPTRTDLPPLPYVQTRRVDHRLDFRRH
jgi:hypothetical protein